MFTNAYGDLRFFRYFSLAKKSSKRKNISEKAYKATAFDGSTAIIPKSMPEIAEGIGAEAEEVVIYRKGGILKDEFKDLKHSNSWERNH